MIEMSDTAITKIKELLADEENDQLFLRVGVREGGCSGFSYVMGVDDAQHDGDTILDFHGLTVAVGQDDLKYINGLKIDYKDSGMSGGFTMENPNAIATCGCGSSFRTRQDAGKAEVCE
ncbi:HesB/IscA family protein [Gorillibacterium massiliense]|uniref:HesB/IscA family protein n=1 Tax=Gorillibacterium massiliense TaxID=1280390 RepID=UPI0004AF69DA|nr:iron-sulfur cluster assembly accessory protein [Gorillibacterium massiliense]